MNFEHLIAINDPGNPLVVPLTRRQLWVGLLQRVDNPLLFLPGLQGFTIHQRQFDSAVRELDFGTTKMRDCVTLTEEAAVRFDVEPGDQHAGGSLTIRIEEPVPDHLFLRFTYTTGLATQAGSE